MAIVVHGMTADNLVIFGKKPMQDLNLSLAAKGLYAYMVSQLPDSEVSFEKAAQDNSESIGVVRSAAAELVRFGYLNADFVIQDIY